MKLIRRPVLKSDDKAIAHALKHINMNHPNTDGYEVILHNWEKNGKTSWSARKWANKATIWLRRITVHTPDTDGLGITFIFETKPDTRWEYVNGYSEWDGRKDVNCRTLRLVDKKRLEWDDPKKMDLLGGKVAVEEAIYTTNGTTLQRSDATEAMLRLVCTWVTKHGYEAQKEGEEE